MHHSPPFPSSCVPTAICVLAAVFTVAVPSTVQASSPAERHRTQVGFELGISSAPSNDQVQWLWAPAANIGYTMRPGWSVGVERLTWGTAPIAAGPRCHFGLTPYVERYTFVRPRTQLFGLAGLGWQTRWGAGLDNATGLSVAAGGGLRQWVSPRFSIGTKLRAVHVLSNGWAMSPRILPGGATIMTWLLLLEGHI